MDSILFEITIPGKPISKKRPRFLKTGRTYDPQCDEKRAIKALIAAEYDLIEPLDGPLDVTILFDMPYPKSWTKKRKANYQKEPHLVVPDLDNLAKFYLDCMNEITFHDDKQIVRIYAAKNYCDHAGSTIIKLEKPDV